VGINRSSQRFKALPLLLNRLAIFRGYSIEILTDNGIESTLVSMIIFCDEKHVKHIFTDPGRPMQNGCTESFNGKLRDGCLNQHWFKTIAKAREIIQAWKQEYNNLRPHSSLNNMTPQEYAIFLRSMPKTNFHVGWATCDRSVYV
jgi:putative transposase